MDPCEARYRPARRTRELAGWPTHESAGASCWGGGVPGPMPAGEWRQRHWRRAWSLGHGPLRVHVKVAASARLVKTELCTSAGKGDEAYCRHLVALCLLVLTLFFSLSTGRPGGPTQYCRVGNARVPGSIIVRVEPTVEGTCLVLFLPWWTVFDTILFPKL